MVALGMITIDSSDARRLAAWWAERLGGEIVADYDGYFCMVQAPGLPIPLGVQLVEAPTPGKNRIHLDLSRSADEERDALVAAWVAAGAAHLGERGDSDFRWDTFADPDGNEFCISQPH